MMDLQIEVISQVKCIDKCLEIWKEEKIYSLEQIEEQRDELDDDIQANLKEKLGDKIAKITEWSDKVKRIVRGAELQTKQQRSKKGISLTENLTVAESLND